MQIEIITLTPRSATLEIRNGEPYRSPWMHHVFLDGVAVYQQHENVFVLRDLQPDTPYSFEVRSGQDSERVSLCTPAEPWRLDVREFGAVGDGAHDDTAALQAAIACCPHNGTVHLPAGDWLSGPLFLKSSMRLELAKGSRLLGQREIARWPLLPANLPHAKGEPRVLGTWEGRPAVCHASLLNVIDACDVTICGAGVIDAQAGFDTWWSRPKTPFAGWRPRTLLLAHSRRIHVDGVTLRNSPSWTLHALLSRELVFSALRVEAPSTSPNTDGIDPESCEQVSIIGVHVSTGDDCVAIKSGKRNPDGPAPPPSRHVRISNSLMEDGHGAVVIGSENAGGVYDVVARDCVFRGTDRGLRIKTRRGRGRDAVVDGVRLENVAMEYVGSPFVVNSFYWCDPDGREPHVGDRQPRAVDDGTPTIRNLSLDGVRSENTAHSAAYVLGLPEAPIEGLSIRNYRVRYDPDATAGYPEMAEGIPEIRHHGMYLLNVRRAELRDIDIEGQQGPSMELENVE